MPAGSAAATGPRTVAPRLRASASADCPLSSSAAKRSIGRARESAGGSSQAEIPDRARDEQRGRRAFAARDVLYQRGAVVRHRRGDLRGAGSPVAVRRPGGVGLAEGVRLGQAVGERTGAPPLGEGERRFRAAAPRECRDHAGGRSLRVVFPERRRREGIPAELGGRQPGAPVLEVVAGVGQLALRPVQIAARRIRLRQPRTHGVPDELVAGRGPAQEIGEQADGIGRMALGQRQTAAVVHDAVAHVVHAPRVRRRVGGGELAGRLVPVALADGDPGEPLAGEHDVLEEIPPLRHGEAFKERGPRGGELARGRLDLARVLAGDHAAFGEPERIADVGRPAELVGGGREIAHAERQHAEPTVGVAQALEVPGDAGACHGLLEGQPCLPQAAVRLEDVAPARLDPGQARLLVRGPEQRGRPVHGDERAVVMAPQALQQPRDLEAMAGQLPLADPLGHGGAVPDQRRAVLVSRPRPDTGRGGRDTRRGRGCRPAEASRAPYRAWRRARSGRRFAYW